MREIESGRAVGRLKVPRYDITPAVSSRDREVVAASQE